MTNEEQNPIIAHALRELKISGADETMQGFKDLMELVEVFSKQVHSPSTRHIVLSMFVQVAKMEPLSPLTGAEDEWEQISPHVRRNNRCHRVMWEAGVGPYDSQGIVFVDEKGEMFVRDPQSRRKITFPYVLQTQYVRINEPRIIVPNRKLN